MLASVEEKKLVTEVVFLKEIPILPPEDGFEPVKTVIVNLSPTLNVRAVPDPTPDVVKV